MPRAAYLLASCQQTKNIYKSRTHSVYDAAGVCGAVDARNLKLDLKKNAGFKNYGRLASHPSVPFALPLQVLVRAGQKHWS